MHTLDELTRAIEADADAEVAEALHRDPSLVSMTTQDGDTLLHIACRQKRAAIVQSLLAHEPDVDARGLHGWTPLHCAVSDGSRRSVPIVQMLMASGADPALQDDQGFSVSEWARRDMWEALDSVLELLAAPAAATAPVPAALVGDDFADTVARMQAIERRGHTEAALARLVDRFVRGERCDVATAMQRLPAAEVRCLEDARRILDVIATSSWASPLRDLLARELRPADVVRLLDAYERASADR